MGATGEKSCMPATERHARAATNELVPRSQQSSPGPVSHKTTLCPRGSTHCASQLRGILRASHACRAHVAPPRATRHRLHVAQSFAAPVEHFTCPMPCDLVLVAPLVRLATGACESEMLGASDSGVLCSVEAPILGHASSFRCSSVRDERASLDARAVRRPKLGAQDGCLQGAFATLALCQGRVEGMARALGGCLAGGRCRPLDGRRCCCQERGPPVPRVRAPSPI